MSKPTLGRGLGDLIGAQGATGQPSAPGTMDGGLRTLIGGAPRESANLESAPASITAVPETSRSSSTKAIAIAALSSADVTLLGWTAHYAITHQHALGWIGTAACILSTLMAAACGCAALLVSRSGK